MRNSWTASAEDTFIPSCNTELYRLPEYRAYPRTDNALRQAIRRIVQLGERSK